MFTPHTHFGTKTWSLRQFLTEVMKWPLTETGSFDTLPTFKEGWTLGATRLFRQTYTDLLDDENRAAIMPIIRDYKSDIYGPHNFTVYADLYVKDQKSQDKLILLFTLADMLTSHGELHADRTELRKLYSGRHVPIANSDNWKRHMCYVFTWGNSEMFRHTTYQEIIDKNWKDFVGDVKKWTEVLDLPPFNLTILPDTYGLYHL